MPKWTRRVHKIAARNPDALPKWLRQPQAEKAWDRVSWQTEGGISADDAARPILMMLDWLCRRGLLTHHGIAILKLARGGEVGSLCLTSSMVEPRAAAFLDAYWERWWESNGINLSISPNCTESALAAIEACWVAFTADNQKA